MRTLGDDALARSVRQKSRDQDTGESALEDEARKYSVSNYDEDTTEPTQMKDAGGDSCEELIFSVLVAFLRAYTLKVDWLKY